MLNIAQIIKLSRQLQKFAEVETKSGILICDGELAEGVEVFVEQDGEVIPAPSAEYETEDKVIVVEDGKVTAIKDKEEQPKDDAPADEKPAEAPAEVETEEQPAEDPAAAPAEDDKDAKIAELEARIAELEAENAELKEKLGVAEEALSKPVKTDTKLEKQNKTLKNYFKK